MTVGTFTKKYEIQPNEQQRQALTKALKSTTEGYLLLGKSVMVLVESFEEGKIVASQIVDDKMQWQGIIGVSGGVKIL